MNISFKEIKNLQKNKKARDEQGLFVTKIFKKIKRPAMSRAFLSRKELSSAVKPRPIGSRLFLRQRNLPENIRIFSAAFRMIYRLSVTSKRSGSPVFPTQSHRRVSSQ